MEKLRNVTVNLSGLDLTYAKLLVETKLCVSLSEIVRFSLYDLLLNFPMNVEYQIGNKFGVPFQFSPKFREYFLNKYPSFLQSIQHKYSQSGFSTLTCIAFHNFISKCRVKKILFEVWNIGEIGESISRRERLEIIESIR